MILVADIGGTNARLSVSDRNLRPVDPQTYQCEEFPDIADACDDYLARRGAEPIDTGCFAVASPISGDQVQLTNSPWSFSIQSLRDRLGFRQLRVVNDFSAVAAALPYLDSNELSPIGNKRPLPIETSVAIGPGTGLGVSALIRNGDRRAVVSGEGGHASFAPVNEEEMKIWEILRDKHGRVSNERLLCGSGLVEIAEASARIADAPHDHRAPAEITAHALQDDCVICGHSTRLFLDILASVAGDVGLYFGARGGVFIAGGIVPRILSLINADSFRARFESKGRMTKVASAIPTSVVTCEYPGLVGAAAIAADSINIGHTA